MSGESYIAIDLKSFYASVECVMRGLDPMNTNLLVADVSRTEKTICLAVSPSLKSYGISGRARLFEAIATLRVANEKRRRLTPRGRLVGSSFDKRMLDSDPSLAIDYIAAPPRMALYLEYSAKIYDVYLRYVAPEDIHVYSVDEVFINATPYLTLYKTTAHDLARRMIKDVLDTTGITATAGIGTNLYLCKVAMDIVAKHVEADGDGVRIAELDEASYRRLLWTHRPLTDFWRVGRGIAAKLEARGIYTMGDVARTSLTDEELFYRLFGVNAELLIDHAWGYEPCTMEDIKAYKPDSTSLGSGQVLHCAYGYDKARLIVREMIDTLSLDLVEKGLCTDQIVLSVGYDIDNLKDGGFDGEVSLDFYGRRVPKMAHGTATLPRKSSSTMELTNAALELFDKIVDKRLSVRRINLTAARLVKEGEYKAGEQLDILTLINGGDAAHEEREIRRKKERKIQSAVLDIKKKYGKNSIIKGMNLEDGATAKDRNEQIGGHKA